MRGVRQPTDSAGRRCSGPHDEGPACAARLDGFRGFGHPPGRRGQALDPGGPGIDPDPRRDGVGACIAEDVTTAVAGQQRTGPAGVAPGAGPDADQELPPDAGGQAPPAGTFLGSPAGGGAAVGGAAVGGLSGSPRKPDRIQTDSIRTLRGRQSPVRLMRPHRSRSRDCSTDGYRPAYRPTRLGPEKRCGAPVSPARAAIRVRATCYSRACAALGRPTRMARSAAGRRFDHHLRGLPRARKPFREEDTLLKPAPPAPGSADPTAAAYPLVHPQQPAYPSHGRAEPRPQAGSPRPASPPDGRHPGDPRGATTAAHRGATGLPAAEQCSECRLAPEN